MIGVRVDGTKELIALAEGYRESSGSWADVLRDCAPRHARPGPGRLTHTAAPGDVEVLPRPLPAAGA